MAKVFIVQYSNWIAYEGGSDTNCCVCSTREKAEAVIARSFKHLGIDLPEPNDAGEWMINDDHGDATYMSIREFDIDNEIAEPEQWVYCRSEFHSVQYPDVNYGKLGERYRVDEVVKDSWGQPLYYRLSQFDMDQRKFVPLADQFNEGQGGLLNIDRFEILYT